jgi:hypothetical protein
LQRRPWPFKSSGKRLSGATKGPGMTTTFQQSAISAGLYLGLMERCLTNTIYGDGYTTWQEPAVER